MTDQQTTPVPATPGFGRRDFLQLAGGAAVGAGAVAAVLAWLRIGGSSPKAPVDPTAFTMPGPFAGRVVEVHHPGSMVNGKVQAEPVKQMLSQGLAELTGAGDATAAWKRFFGPGDVVGIKVNPVGKRNPKYPHIQEVITNPETIREVIAGLMSAGVKANDIIVFERYRDEFLACGYEKNLPEGVRWDAASIAYEDDQTAVDGYAERYAKFRTDGSAKVSGYDPDVFVTLDFIFPGIHKADDSKCRRSHLCNIVSKQVNKVVNLCLLKDHSSSGITGALKNLSHGLFNNVARSHGNAAMTHCHTFIPAVLSRPEVRSKVVLNIMEGLRGMYQGGPGIKHPGVATWEYKSILLSTDPVAMDQVAWKIIDDRRLEAGMPKVGDTGVRGKPMMFKIPRKNRETGEIVETLENVEDADYRQIQHIELAGHLGLGTFGPDVRRQRLSLG